ncbi:MAG TPA: hypothetical protein VFM94_06275 [Solirubrobacterales bacterium]|nr:hypothetical protein [Solirubrobacterales bacterium]
MRFLLGVADAVRWPFERLAWSVERGVLWPLRERFAGRHPSGHRAGAAALGAIAIAAILVGVLLLPNQGTQTPEQTAAPTRVAIATPEPAPPTEPKGPVLKGATPKFDVAGGVGVAKSASDAPNATNATADDETDPSTAGEPGEEAAATASSRKPVPAGPAAMKVARRFSEAFVFYEVGERPARAKTVFTETATPELAAALGERPPRQPAEAEVPKARVLNIVPGPRAGRAYTVSVSMLRVGLTTELRLELNKLHGAWVVTDVRG